MIRASQHLVEDIFSSSLSARGIAGGVVTQTYFETHFGIISPDGTVNKNEDVTVSSNVVSVLQAGAFFGALGSAPLSGRRLDRSSASCVLIWAPFTAHFGRRWTLVGFTLVFCVGAVSLAWQHYETSH